MKQNFKRIWLIVCMVTCLLSLSACAAAESAQDEVDPTVSTQLAADMSEQLKYIAGLSDAEMDQMIPGYEQQQLYVFAEALRSWQSVGKETGAFIEVISSTVDKTEDGYSCTVKAKFELRNADMKVLLGDDGVTSSISFVPEYSLPEKMTKAAYNTLMGMGTVFGVLIFIIFIISLFKYIRVFEERMKGSGEAAVPVAVPVPAPAPVMMAAVEEENLTDDLELVAVITAAIAASQNTAVEGLVVRSIKRASGAKWKRA